LFTLPIKQEAALSAQVIIATEKTFKVNCLLKTY